MITKESIDEIVDEVINKFEMNKEEIKKRKPQPFRYITDKEEIKALLNEEENTHITIMKSPDQVKIIEDKLCIFGLGDIETIENVIRRHEASRKFK